MEPATEPSNFLGTATELSPKIITPSWWLSVVCNCSVARSSPLVVPCPSHHPRPLLALAANAQLGAYPSGFQTSISPTVSASPVSCSPPQHYICGADLVRRSLCLGVSHGPMTGSGGGAAATLCQGCRAPQAASVMHSAANGIPHQQDKQGDSYERNQCGFAQMRRIVCPTMLQSKATCSRGAARRIATGRAAV